MTDLQDFFDQLVLFVPAGGQLLDCFFFLGDLFGNLAIVQFTLAEVGFLIAFQRIQLALQLAEPFFLQLDDKRL